MHDELILAGMGSVLAAGIASAAVGLADDVMFAGIDLSGGYKSVGEVGLELGKKVASAAVSVGVGAAFNGVGKITETIDAAGEAVKVVEKGGLSKMLEGKLGDGIGQVALNVGLAGAKILTTSTINSGINA
ncbi:MAG: hypothetical protein LBF83_02380, partial [Spirochaetaceae bacterium]|nr:hypothetical protein [Spirochaetaceae bacterium]